MRFFRVCVISAPAVVLAFMLGAMQSKAAITTISPVFEDPVTSRQYQLLSNGNWTDSQAKRNRSVEISSQSPPRNNRILFSVCSAATAACSASSGQASTTPPRIWVAARMPAISNGSAAHPSRTRTGPPTNPTTPETLSFGSPCTTPTLTTPAVGTTGPTARAIRSASNSSELSNSSRSQRQFRWVVWAAFCC